MVRYDERNGMKAWGSIAEIETRRRIMVSVAAYAYEVKDDPIWPDAKYDRECLKVDLTIRTRNSEMDRWFKENFDPFTGLWVHDHPNRKGLNRIYKLMKRK